MEQQQQQPTTTINNNNNNNEQQQQQTSNNNNNSKILTILRNKQPGLIEQEENHKTWNEILLTQGRLAQLRLERPAEEEIVELITQELITAKQQEHQSSLVRELIRLYENYHHHSQEQEQEDEEERRADNLARRVLINWGKREPKELFTILDRLLFARSTATTDEDAGQAEGEEEFGALGLLLDFLSHQPYSIHTIRATGLLNNLVLRLIAAPQPPGSATPGRPPRRSLKLSIDALLLILPRVSSLIALYLPFLFLGFASSLCSAHAPPDNNTLNLAPLPPIHLDFLLSLDNALLNLFSFLYGIAPCNFLDFLRNPVDLFLAFSPPLNNNGEPSPVELDDRFKALQQESSRAELEALAPVDRLRSLVLPLMDRHRLNKNLVLMAPSSERKEIAHRLKMYEPAELIEKCERTLIVAASSEVGELGARDEVTQVGELLGWCVRGSKSTDPAGSSTTVKPEEQQLERPSTPPSIPAPLSDPPEVPQASVVQPGLQKQIEQLRTDNQMLRSQLHLELYLKSQHLQQLGSVHKQNILGAGLEAENQNLLRMNKELRKKLRQKHESEQEKQSSNLITSKNKVAYQELIKKKNLALKNDNLAFLSAKFSLLNQINELEKAIELQNKNLLFVQSEAHELKNQLTLLEPELRTMESLQTQTTSLSNALLVWDDDLRRFREARSRIDSLRAQARKWLSQASCNELENQQLRAQLLSQQERINRLELENECFKKRSTGRTLLDPDSRPPLTDDDDDARMMDTSHDRNSCRMRSRKKLENLAKLVDEYRHENFELRRRIVEWDIEGRRVEADQSVGKQAVAVVEGAGERAGGAVKGVEEGSVEVAEGEAGGAEEERVDVGGELGAGEAGGGEAAAVEVGEMDEGGMKDGALEEDRTEVNDDGDPSTTQAFDRSDKEAPTSVTPTTAAPLLQDQQPPEDPVPAPAMSATRPVDQGDEPSCLSVDDGATATVN
ncbi:hypothetical protein PGT21_017160 [Puccinia graminis f. sp. tritici]|uniref:Uncharacterized protein n=2 Tax=Puccinia graminis f. sp. tritici TaxID=56615 RepID=E3KSF5_PUCGT|nr:uncharacterized protein PGTG_12825 [Puccinia graminis f. sp. tritici CRL 75-36-700-3]EFP87241.1 hypothetical protein PGTG_12825 [Puccinia graminis f. sp. tritici CRL 75-36-700-3]KAA1111955.1 hypothetical protein PGT21_017160 [Puccinia graminis f. sp. tritici]